MMLIKVIEKSFGGDVDRELNVLTRRAEQISHMLGLLLMGGTYQR